jgi:prokaryotic YEATS domain
MLAPFIALLLVADPVPPTVKAVPSPSPCSAQECAAAAAESEIRLAKAKTELAKSQVELATATAAQKKAEREPGCPCTEAVKADDERVKFFLDFGLRAFLAIIGAWIVFRILPSITDFTISFFGNTIAGKLGPTTPPPPPPPQGGTGSNEAAVIEEAFRNRKEAVPPPLIQRADEEEAYRVAGIDRYTIYLAHRVRRVSGSQNRRLTMYLDADEPEFLSKVEKVTYQLHPTFVPREVTVTSRGDGFQYEVVAWGEFVLFALVYFKGVSNPVQLSRYLNF